MIASSHKFTPHKYTLMNNFSIQYAFCCHRCRQFGVNFGYGTLEAPAASVTVASDVDAPMTETPMSETPMSERDDM